MRSLVKSWRREGADGMGKADFHPEGAEDMKKTPGRGAIPL